MFKTGVSLSTNASGIKVKRIEKLLGVINCRVTKSNLTLGPIKTKSPHMCPQTSKASPLLYTSVLLLLAYLFTEG